MSHSLLVYRDGGKEFSPNELDDLESWLRARSWIAVEARGQGWMRWTGSGDAALRMVHALSTSPLHDIWLTDEETSFAGRISRLASFDSYEDAKTEILRWFEVGANA